MNITCKRLLAPTLGELLQIRSIYETTFPTSERKPFDTFVPRLAMGDYICIVAHPDENPKKVVAFALLLPLPTVSLTFLEYVAVESGAQGQGVGSQLFRDVAAYFRNENLAQGLVWEVEPPSDDPMDEKNRRIRFYERLSARLIDLSTPYAMPNLELRRGGVPLRLMQLPMNKQPDKVGLSAIVKDIYQVAYPGWDNLRDEILHELGKLPG